MTSVPKIRSRILRGSLYFAATAGLVAYAFGALATGLLDDWSGAPAIPPYRSMILAAAAWIFLRDFGHEPLKLKPAYVAGFSSTAAALGVRVLAGAWHLTPLHSLATLAIAPCALVTFFGLKSLRKARAALCLALLALPLSFDTLLRFVFELRLLSTWAAVHLLALARTDVSSEGATLIVGTSVIRVVEACSGFKSLAIAVAFSAVLAQGQPNSQRRAILLFFAPILALLSNVFRIIVVALLYSSGRDSLAQGSFHEWIGIAAFGSAMFVLAWVTAPRSVGMSFVDAIQGGRAFRKAVLGCTPAAVLCFVTLMATGRAVESRLVDKDWLAEPPAAFAAVFDHPPPSWKVESQELTDEELAALERPRVLIRDYYRTEARLPSEIPVELYLVRSVSAEKVSHPPDVCLRGEGYERDSRTDVELPGRPGGVPAEFFVFRRPSSTMQLYLWERVGGIDTRARLAPKFLTTRSSLTFTTIRISVESPPELEREARLELDSFIHSVLPRFLADL